MADKGGWRRRMHMSARPRTPSQLKVPTVNDTEERRTSLASESRGRRDTKQSIQSSSAGRPNTPAIADAEDARSDVGSEASTPHRHRVGPHLSRIISAYHAATSSAAQQPEFGADFWLNIGEYKEPEPKVDPSVVVDSIQTHLFRFPNRPIPVSHHSGLLHLFEDYSKIRQIKEELDSLTKQTLTTWQGAQRVWDQEKEAYQAEIRRLEHIIGKGSQGIFGVIRARQDSAVKRSRGSGKSLSGYKLESAYEFLSREQLDEEILRQSQRVQLYRPSSPSRRMRALSKRLATTTFHDDLPMGKPPRSDYKNPLSRKVSEETGASAAPSEDSVLSFTGDRLPDEESAGEPGLEVLEIAYLALEDLAEIVTRRLGLRMDTFFPKLMKLVTGEDQIQPQEPVAPPQNVRRHVRERSKTDSEIWIPEPRIRHSKSQPDLNSEQVRRRHFSFEPGDDLLMDLSTKDDHNLSVASPRMKPLPLTPPDLGKPQSDNGLSAPFSLSNESHRLTKIPSPTYKPLMGRGRRESSTSSLLTTIHQDDRRRDSSASSIVTAVRHNSIRTTNLPSPMPSPQGSSTRASSRASSQLRNTRPPSARRNSIALAAARAAGEGSNAAVGKEKANGGKTNSRRSASSAATVSTRHPESENEKKSENDEPKRKK